MHDDYRESEADLREMPRTVPTAEEKRESAQIVKDYLANIQSQFYPDDQKRFFQDRKFLIRCITLPARYLHKRGVALDDAFYRKILNEILKGIKQHTRARDFKSFGSYLLVCVQRHLKHHDEDYVAKGKEIRDARSMKTAKSILDGLQPVENPEQFTGSLADLSYLVGSGRKKTPARKKTRTPEPDNEQISLF